MKERVEDLGKISVLTKNILDGELFTGFDRPPRAKDAVDWFFARERETQIDLIHDLYYRIENLKEDLLEVWTIAEGIKDDN